MDRGNIVFNLIFFGVSGYSNLVKRGAPQIRDSAALASCTAPPPPPPSNPGGGLCAMAVAPPPPPPDLEVAPEATGQPHDLILAVFCCFTVNLHLSSGRYHLFLFALFDKETGIVG